MSDTFTTGKTFVTGEQVTATDLNNAVNQATPKVALTDDLSITVNASNKLTVKDGDATNGIPLTKLKHIIGHSVIGNTGSATAAPTNIEVAANEAVLGNSAGNGLITDKIDTDNVKDDAITQGKTDFINSTTGEQTLTGTSPNLKFNDTNNVVTNKPFINGNTTDGGLHVRAQEANSVIQNLGTGKVLLATSDTPGSSVSNVSQYVTRLEVSSTSGKDLADAASAGAKVVGDLQVTGDINAAGGAKIAGDVTITDPSPRLTFNDTTNANTSPFIEGSNDGHLVLYTRESGSDINLDPEHEVIMKSNNGSTVVFRASDASSKDAAGNTGQQGIKVEGDIWATSDIRADGVAKIPTVQDNITIQGSAPIIYFNDSDNSGANPSIGGDSNFGNLSLNASENGAEVNTYSGGSLRFQVGQDVSEDATGTTSAGIRSKNDIYAEGDLKVDGDVNIGGDIVTDIVLKSASPKITFEETDVSIADPYIQSFNSGNLELKTAQANSVVKLDGKDGLVVEYDGTNALLEASATAAKDAGGNSNQRGIKVTNDIYALGDISADGDVVASLSSDKRLKDNIAPIQDATSKVNKLSGNTFDWNDKSKYSGSDVGVIAQEVQEIIPSAVKETEEGYLKVEYTKIVPLLIESIKELSAKVQELEAKVK